MLKKAERIDGEEVIYQRSKKTWEGYELGVKKLNLSLAHFGIEKTFNSLTDEDVTYMLFNRVAMYLHTVAKTPQGDVFAPLTVLQYLSGVYNAVYEKFKHVSIFNEGLVWNRRLSKMIPEWYSDLRENLLRELVVSIQEDGKKLTSKSLPIGRRAATRIGEYLLKKSTSESVILSNVNTNCHLNGGRTGEIALASHNLMEFDYDEGVGKIDWNQRKTISVLEIYYYPNNEDNYVLCWYHSLCRQWLADPNNNFLRKKNAAHEDGSNKDEQWMYPLLSCNDTPVSVINKYLKEVFNSAHITGTGYRIGTINEVAEGPGLSTLHQVVISGHDYKNVCTVFEYTLSAGVAVKKSCKWLAGGLPTRRHVIPTLPTLDTMTGIELNKWKRLVMSLTPQADYHYGGRLWGITKIAISSWLLYYPKFLMDYGRSQICVRNFASILEECSFSNVHVHDWTQAVKEAFVDATVRCYDNEAWDGPFGVSLRAMQTTLPLMEVC